MDKKRGACDHRGLGSWETGWRSPSFNPSWTLGKIIILYNSARKDYDHEHSPRSSERLPRVALEEPRTKRKGKKKGAKRNLRANLILSFFRHRLLSIAPLNSYGSDTFEAIIESRCRDRKHIYYGLACVYRIFFESLTQCCVVTTSPSAPSRAC